MKAKKRNPVSAKVKPPEEKDLPYPVVKWPYPQPKSGQNDQNLLAQLILRIGYYLQLLQKTKPDPIHEDVLREAMDELVGVCLANTRAYLFATSVRSVMNKYANTSSGWGLIVRVAATEARNPSSEPDPDPARKWFFVGQYMVAAETYDDDQLKELRRWLEDVATVTFSEEMLERAHKTKCSLLDVTLALLHEKSPGIWEPSVKGGEKSRFNGRELTFNEYRTLECLALHGCGEQGMSYVALERKLNSSAPRNAVTMLRRYPETKPFISSRGRPRFIGACPHPPPRPK